MHAADEAALATQPSQEPPPAAGVEGEETRSRLARLVEGLPENQREVVLLRFQNGHSYKEISRITAHSVSNVGYLLHQAMKQLAERLNHSREVRP